jgi:hypothetical protein
MFYIINYREGLYLCNNSSFSFENINITQNNVLSIFYDLSALNSDNINVDNKNRNKISICFPFAVLLQLFPDRVKEIFENYFDPASVLNNRIRNTELYSGDKNNTSPNSSIW